MSEKDRQTFSTGAQRSVRCPRYDLIPKCAIDRLAVRFTGDIVNNLPTGGALKYGESNWERGLPTSDTINHIMHHLTSWTETFRQAMIGAMNLGITDEKEVMDYVLSHMKEHSNTDDDLAGAMWGICVLMRQEETAMYHDEKFPIKTIPGVVKSTGLSQRSSRASRPRKRTK